MVDPEEADPLPANPPLYSRSFSSRADAVQSRSSVNAFHLRRRTVPPVFFERQGDVGEPVGSQLLPAIQTPETAFSNWDWLKPSSVLFKLGESAKCTDTLADNSVYSHFSATTGEVSDARLFDSAPATSDEGMDADSRSVSFPGNLWELSHMNSLASMFSNLSEPVPIPWVAEKDTCASGVQGINEQGELPTDTLSDTSIANGTATSLYNNASGITPSLPAALLHDIKPKRNRIAPGSRKLSLVHGYEGFANREGEDLRTSQACSQACSSGSVTPRRQSIGTNYRNKDKSSSFFSSLFEGWLLDETPAATAVKSPQKDVATNLPYRFHRCPDSHTSDTFSKIPSVAERRRSTSHSAQLPPNVIIRERQNIDLVSVETAQPISRRFTVSGATPHLRSLLNPAGSHFSCATLDDDTPLQVKAERQKGNAGSLETSSAFADPAEPTPLSLISSSPDRTIFKKCNAIPPSEMTLSLLKSIPRGVNGELLSVGSMYHATGTCRPCLFLNNPVKTCQNGIRCLFCHYYHPPKHRTRVSKKKRLKAKRREEAKLLSGEAQAKPGHNSDMMHWCTYSDSSSFPLLLLNQSSNNL